ncbi:hypothetical protein A9Q98_10995 [Thalassotalea sp. 42_200_T64]|nr:hypothetical protein A9Q98_10995 [Thalassotalea sp. 42_200_T64]
MNYSEQQIINQCKQWLEKIIIGLNFCPFAKKEFVQNTIAYSVFTNVDMETALQGVIEECQCLDENPEMETSLLIYPDNFQYFEDYLDLVHFAEQLLIREGYEGVYQIASFHPDYYFAGVDEDDDSNYTNRSPFPILHLIKEESLAKAVKAHPDAAGIPDKNIEVCQQKGGNFFADFLNHIKNN